MISCSLREHRFNYLIILFIGKCQFGSMIGGHGAVFFFSDTKDCQLSCGITIFWIFLGFRGAFVAFVVGTGGVAQG